jgi:hypothetical protein
MGQISSHRDRVTAAPYFYRHRRGAYADRLEFQPRAQARKLGLWGVCPRTPYNPVRDRDAEIASEFQRRPWDGTNGTAGEYLDPWKIVIVRYNALSPTFTPI